MLTFRSCLQVLPLLLCVNLYFPSHPGSSHISVQQSVLSLISHYSASRGVICYRWSFHYTLCATDRPSGYKHTHSVSLPPVNTPKQVFVVGSQRLIFLPLHSGRRAKCVNHMINIPTSFRALCNMLCVSYVCVPRVTGANPAIFGLLFRGLEK